MIEELRQFENLGSPNFFWEMFTLLILKKVRWSKLDFNKHFSNRIIDNDHIFDGCLPLLEITKIINVDSNGKVVTDVKIDKSMFNKNCLKHKLIMLILTILKEDEIFMDIFSSKYLTYDIIFHRIQLSNNAFGFKYANLKKLLVEFGFLINHPSKKISKLVLNNKYKKYFDKNMLPAIKNKKMNVGKLQQIIEKKRILGSQAEDFVLEYENKRLNNHKKNDEIEKISEYDVSAGYDIISFNSLESKIIDRFIEVKSFNESVNFYWSQNEVETSRIKNENYYLYLVNRSKLNKKDYKPMIIKNPYKNVLKNDKWDKTISKYYIELFQ